MRTFVIPFYAQCFANVPWRMEHNLLTEKSVVGDFQFPGDMQETARNRWAWDRTFTPHTWSFSLINRITPLKLFKTSQSTFLGRRVTISHEYDRPQKKATSSARDDYSHSFSLVATVYAISSGLASTERSHTCVREGKIPSFDISRLHFLSSNQRR